MGNELKCTGRSGKKSAEGKALLETNELIFRSAELKAKIPFAEMADVKAADGELRVKTKDGAAYAFAIGAQAEKWREKILHPKTRMEKLGIKAGNRVALEGKFDDDFLKELKGAKVVVSDRTAGEADWIFWSVENKPDLGEFAKKAKKLSGPSGLWVIYPKGRKEMTEADVISAGRKAGLKDVKVVGFSERCTGLKFVIPVEKR